MRLARMVFPSIIYVGLAGGPGVEPGRSLPPIAMPQDFLRRCVIINAAYAPAASRCAASFFCGRLLFFLSAGGL